MKGLVSGILPHLFKFLKSLNPDLSNVSLKIIDNIVNEDNEDLTEAVYEAEIGEAIVNLIEENLDTDYVIFCRFHE